MTDMDQDARRKQLYGLLGDLPERGRPISARLIAEERRSGYVLEKLLLDLNGVEDVPAYLTRPLGARGRIPFVLYNHAHGGDYVLGKDELLLGREVLYDPPYVEVLSGMGYGVLCIDTWAFGERRGLTEQSIFKRMLWSGQVMWGMMVYDSIRAVDYLVSRDDVDTERIGTLGISMGSTMAWWTAALDVRVKVCVDLCCLTDFHSLVDRGLDHHGVYYFVPSLLKHFTTGQINALIAPRPHLGTRRELRQADAAGGPGPHRRGGEGGLRRRGRAGGLAPVPLRHRPLRDRGHARRGRRLPAQVAVEIPPTHWA